MASSSEGEHRTKRVKLTNDDSVSEDVARTRAITVEASVNDLMAKQDLKDQQSIDSICAGLYLIGNDEEEDKFYASQKAQEDQHDEQPEEQGNEEDLESSQSAPLRFFERGLIDRTVHDLDHFIEFEGVEMPFYRLDRLYKCQPLPTPDNMTLVPHAWQLKGAAQGLLCCESKFKGFLLGDGMGVGKTLTAILMMHALKDKPGMSLVVCPAAVCHKWVATIDNAWRPGKGMKALLLDSARTTALELMESGVDIVVCSYEFVERNSRDFRNFPEDFSDYRDADQADRGPMPILPTSALTSDVWRDVGMPWKLMVLDECQRVNKRESVTHQALQAVPAEATVCISGTMAHNKYYNFDGSIAFLRNTPFQNTSDFFRILQIKDQNSPTTMSLRLFQRFLQAVMIARPADTIKLPGIVNQKWKFKLWDFEESKVKECYKLYQQEMRRLQLSKRAKGKVPRTRGGASDKENMAAFKWLVKAQLYAAHPLLAENYEEHLALVEDARLQAKSNDPEDDIVPDESVAGPSAVTDTTSAADDDEEMLEGDEREPDSDDDDEETANKMEADVVNSYENLTDSLEAEPLTKRKAWLERLKLVSHAQILSSRVVHTLRSLHKLRDAFPGERIVIVSQYLKFLDILAEYFDRRDSQGYYRYDGTVSLEKRVRIERDFAQSDGHSPLLMTCGAGGVGIDLQCASIVIQAEPWWNHNVELQTICRCYRQGQLRIVKWIQIYAFNSIIDEEMVRIQKRKTAINKELMGALIRRHDQDPRIMPLIVYEDETTARALFKLIHFGVTGEDLPHDPELDE